MINEIAKPSKDKGALQGFETEWRNRFQEFAEARDDDAGIAGWTKTGLEARVRRFQGLWKPALATQCWLDAGCGAGTYSRILVDRGATTVGADYSLLALQKAKLRRTDPILYVAADVRKLPFAAMAFDGVICFGVVQALSESAPAIRELSSLVKPGGELWVDALNRWCLVHLLEIIRRKIKGKRRHLRYESPNQIKRLMADSALSNVKLHWLPILPGRLQRYQHWVETPFIRAALRYVPFFGLLFCHAFIVRANKCGPALR